MTRIAKIANEIDRLTDEAIIEELRAVLQDEDRIAEAIAGRLAAQGLSRAATPRIRDTLARAEVAPAAPPAAGDSTPRAAAKTAAQPLDPSADAAAKPARRINADAPWPRRATHALTAQGRPAVAQYDTARNRMTLLAGSEIAPRWIARDCSYRHALENIITDPAATDTRDGRVVLVRDVVCTSPACAASLVAGCAVPCHMWQTRLGEALPRTYRRASGVFANGYAAQPAGASHDALVYTARHRRAVAEASVPQRGQSPGAVPAIQAGPRHPARPSAGAA